VTRVFPADGKFTAWQREYYGIYLRLYRALMTSIKVHAKPADVIADALVKMDRAVASFEFTDDKIRAAAVQFVERYRKSKARSLGHNVGLEVHDVPSFTETLEPGQVFTIEPAMQIPELHLGIRLEDMLLITESGYENLSAFVPIEIADIEKTMTRHGLSDATAKLK
jgi:Xaa-Pro aminopeptidase